MKKCKDIENKLPLYLDDLLTAGDKKAVEEHLKSCSRCTQELVRLSETRTVVSTLSEVDPPPWFKQKIMARVREESGKKVFAAKWFSPLKIKIPVQIFATVCIAVLAVYIYRAGDDRMKEVMPSQVPPSVVAIQEDRSDAQTTELSPDADKKKAAATSGYVGETTVNETKDAAERVVADVNAEGVAVAPAAKSFEQTDAGLEKRKDTDVLDASVPKQSALQARGTAVSPDIVVRSADLDKTAEAIEKLLREYDAEKISRQTTRDKILLQADLREQTLKDFKARLKRQVVFEESGFITADAEGRVSLAIEILKN
jgi:anti-sigma factor RsiW